jgi:hypothetical protein
MKTAMSPYGYVSLFEGDDRSNTASLSSSMQGNSLLIDMTAKVRIVQASFHLSDSLYQ